MSAVLRLPTWHAPTPSPTAVVLRPWRSGDVASVIASEPEVSRESMTARFFTGTSAFPVSYLRHLSTVEPDRWDAVVAVDAAGRFVGWAEYARSSAGDVSAELGVLVVDAWQRQGLATRLVRSLLPRAILSGVRVLEIDVEEGNPAARGAVRSLFGEREPVDRDGGVFHYVIPLIRPVVAGEVRD